MWPFFSGKKTSPSKKQDNGSPKKQQEEAPTTTNPANNDCSIPDNNSKIPSVKQAETEICPTLRKRFLDQCFREGWTYDSKLQHDLLTYMHTSLMDQPHEATQTKLRELYLEYQQNSQLHVNHHQHMTPLWNDSGSSDMTLLQTMDQISKRVAPSTTTTPDNITHNNNDESFHQLYESLYQQQGHCQSRFLLFDGSSMRQKLSTEEEETIKEHLETLRPDWLPLMVVNDDDWKEQVLLFYRRYFPNHDSFINDNNNHRPLPSVGFVLQVLQDMESELGFLTRLNQPIVVVEEEEEGIDADNVCANATTTMTATAASLEECPITRTTPSAVVTTPTTATNNDDDDDNSSVDAMLKQAASDSSVGSGGDQLGTEFESFIRNHVKGGDGKIVETDDDDDDDKEEAQLPVTVTERKTVSTEDKSNKALTDAGEQDDKRCNEAKSRQENKPDDIKQQPEKKPPPITVSESAKKNERTVTATLPTTATTTTAATQSSVKRKQGGDRPDVVRSLHAKPQSNKKKKREKNVFIGERVYAEFPENKEWYWGMIIKVKRDKKDKPLYTVYFDDGDIAEGITPGKLFLEVKAMKEYGLKKVPLPKELRVCKYDSEKDEILIEEQAGEDESDSQQSVAASSAGDDDDGVLTLERMKKKACNKCLLCRRADCGKCATCKENKDANRKQVCLRKMCLSIPEARKKQQAVGFPEGWTFYFSNDAIRDESSVDGLCLVSPSGLKFQSIVNAKNRHKKLLKIRNLEATFYAHIGQDAISPNALMTSGTKRPAPDEQKSQPPKRAPRLSVQEPIMIDLVKDTTPVKPTFSPEGRLLSSTKAVGSIVYCRWENGFYYWAKIMAKYVPVDSNEFCYDIFFADGDVMFGVIDDKDEHGDHSFLTEAEFSAIGLPLPKAPYFLALKKQPFPQVCHRVVSSLKDLHRGRCKKCIRCKLDPCDKCLPCKRFSGKRERKECCFRKMCIENFSLEQKLQVAPGMPGWRFAFVGEEVTAQNDAHLPGLVIVDVNGNKFENVDDAVSSIKNTDGIDTIYMKERFNFAVGAPVYYNDPLDDLIGKGFCFEWYDWKGRKKALYGTITECQRDRLSKSYYNYKVIFDQKSLSEVTVFAPGNSRLRIPSYQHVSLKWAVGGHRIWLLKQGPSSITTDTDYLRTDVWSKRWCTPDERHVQICQTPDGKMLPRLTLYWSGFKLVFSVRTSSIPNAGFGVFVKVTPLNASRIGQDFVLEACQMLDLGVYAPLRPDDIKEEAVFLVKNLLFKLYAEEWSFDSASDTIQTDITDDLTGELHELAKMSVPTYVNECSVEDIPTVQAEHDPEGCVHYLLGIKDRNLRLKADGKETEIFINYGEVYEQVRIRKGYSFTHSQAGRKRQQKSFSIECMEYFLAILQMDATDVTSCFQFFDKIVNRTKKGNQHPFDKDVIHRALAMALLFLLRGRELKAETAQTPYGEEFAIVLKRGEKLVETLLGMYRNSSWSSLFVTGMYRQLTKDILSPLLNDLKGRSPKMAFDKLFSLLTDASMSTTTS